MSVEANNKKARLTSLSGGCASPGRLVSATVSAQARPNTTMSSSELAPSRLAPCTDAHDASPAASSPATTRSAPPLCVITCTTHTHTHTICYYYYFWGLPVNAKVPVNPEPFAFVYLDEWMDLSIFIFFVTRQYVTSASNSANQRGSAKRQKADTKQNRIS